MMKGRRFNHSSTLNTPVVIHKRSQPKHLSKEEVLTFLEKFIDEKENVIETDFSSNADQVDSVSGYDEGSSLVSGVASSKFDTNLTVSLSQLKRLQRDFKGLPPSILISTPASSESSEKTKTNETQEVKEENGNVVMKSASGGTKMKFADE